MMGLKLRSAAFCFIESDGLFLIAKRSETAKNRPNEWDLIGGKVDSGEDSLAAVKREAKEEAGLVLEAPKQIKKITYKRTGRDYYYFTSQTKSKEVKLSYEHNEYKWVAIKDLADLLDHPPHKQAATALESSADG